jgi:hypothetical protein
MPSPRHEIAHLGHAEPLTPAPADPEGNEFCLLKARLDPL